MKLAFVTLFAALACAQQVTQTEPTVVTVTGQAMPLSATAAPVVVLTRQQIENAHSEDVIDLLRQLPFLFVAQSGARGELTTVTLRDGKPNFTLVMFDGIPINDITNVLGGSYDFSTMSTDAVEQIEVVRGPLSSVYGSDAVAGVINIIPRRGEGGPSFEIGAAFGNFLTRDGNAAAFGKIGVFDYSLAGSYFDIGQQVKNDAYSLGTASLNSHVTLGSGKLLRFVVRYQNGEAAGFPPGGGGPEFSILQNPQAVHTVEIAGGAGWRQQVNRAWLYGLDFDVFDRTQNSNVPAILDATKPTFHSVPAEIADTSFNRERFGFSNSLRLGGGFAAEFGAGWKREDGVSSGLLGTIPDNFTLSRVTEDANAALTWSARGLTATAALRADKTSDFHAMYSPSAGVAYRISNRGPRVKASWGRGFKLPSFYALADKVIGNPLLRPEFSRTFDAGIENDFFHRHLRAGLTVFRNSYTDLVDFSATLFRLVNRSQALTQGAELALTMPINSSLELHAHASYLEWTLQDTTEPLRGVPHWQSGGGVSWRILPRWHAQADVVAVGARYDFEVPVPQQTIAGGYSTTSLATSYEFSDALTGFVRVDNLFDQRYHEFIGFPNPGAYVRAGVRYRFR